jgi:hypothetical protein
MTNLLISGSSAWDQTGKTAKKGEEAFSGHFTADEIFSRAIFDWSVSDTVHRDDCTFNP